MTGEAGCIENMLPANGKYCAGKCTGTVTRVTRSSCCKKCNLPLQPGCAASHTCCEEVVDKDGSCDLGSASPLVNGLPNVIECDPNIRELFSQNRLLLKEVNDLKSDNAILKEQSVTILNLLGQVRAALLTSLSVGVRGSTAIEALISEPCRLGTEILGSGGQSAPRVSGAHSTLVAQNSDNVTNEAECSGASRINKDLPMLFSDATRPGNSRKNMKGKNIKPKDAALQASRVLRPGLPECDAARPVPPSVSGSLAGPAAASPPPRRSADAGFVAVRGRRSRRAPVSLVQGTRMDATIKTAKRLFSYHLCNVDPSTTVEQVVDYLKSNGFDEVECFALSSRRPDRYASFRVEIPAARCDDFIKPELWPARVNLRRFFFDTSGITQRLK